MPTNFNGLEVTFNANGILYKGTLDQDIEIDPGDLDQEFMEQPKKFAWWAMLSELAKDKMLGIKNQLDQVYAQVDHKVRSQAAAAIPPVKLTEKMVENSVVTDPVYQSVMKDYLAARKEHGLLSAGREAFAQRKEMLVSLGANYRMQSSDPVVTTEKSKVRAALLVGEQKVREAAQDLVRQAARQAAEAGEGDNGVADSTSDRVISKRQPMRKVKED